MPKVFYLAVLALCTWATVNAAVRADTRDAVTAEPDLEGLAAVPFRVRNETGRPLVCSAVLAHWYSAPIGTVPPGEQLEARLWSKPASGEVFLLNVRDDRMPIQSLWCGYQGADITTRSLVVLDRRAGQVEPPVNMICRSDGETHALDCRRSTAE
ncbi:hypothetical protein [Ancylobacter lacus]|uniref:hypothetical protein n=1 Tax=Ancylobacter lacus TaxID=2579970 RepID=UPI001BCB55B6|nr:hypothetical protein [Ancylobacter lacus]MBS7539858.1 hypothetical protein [Ancylobacter lacus]